MAPRPSHTPSRKKRSSYQQTNEKPPPLPLRRQPLPAPIQKQQHGVLRTLLDGLTCVFPGGTFVSIGPFDRKREERALKRIENDQAPEVGLGVMFAVFKKKAEEEYKEEYEKQRFWWSPRIFRVMPHGLPNISASRNFAKVIDQLFSVPIPGTSVRLPIGLGTFTKLPPAIGPTATVLTSSMVHVMHTARTHHIPIQPILLPSILRQMMDFALSLTPGAGSVLSAPIQAEVHFVSTIQHFLLLRHHTLDDVVSDGMWESKDLKEFLGFKKAVRYPSSLRAFLHHGSNV